MQGSYSLPFHCTPGLFFLSEADIWVDLQLAFSHLSNCWNFSLFTSTSTHSTKSPETFQWYWFCLESLVFWTHFSKHLTEKKLFDNKTYNAPLSFFFKQKEIKRCLHVFLLTAKNRQVQKMILKLPCYSTGSGSHLTSVLAFLSRSRGASWISVHQKLQLRINSWICSAKLALKLVSSEDALQ